MSDTKRKFYVKFGGDITRTNSRFRNSQMSVKYFNIFSNNQADTLFEKWSVGKVEDYNYIFPEYSIHSNTSKTNPIVESYINDYQLSSDNSLFTTGISASGASFSNATIYRREYNVYNRPGLKIQGYYYENKFYTSSTVHTQDTEIAPRTGVFYIDITDIENDGRGYCYSYDATSLRYNLVDKVKVYRGEWEPVVLKTNVVAMYDYNIKNNKSYQYILYPNDKMSFDIEETSGIPQDVQVFANSVDLPVWLADTTYPDSQGKIVTGSMNTSYLTGAPVTPHWGEWSICELIPQTDIEDTPSVKQAYMVNTDQIWLFKYSLETGDQTQNIARSEFQTLGRFPKIGFGNTNYISGDVKALLGSEIILASKEKYVERLRKSRITALSTNEKIEMLEKWQEFVNSKNPKLLKDIKGQSWIVQILSSSNTPYNFYLNQPDTISFKWKQVEDTKNIIIYSSIDQIVEEVEAEGTVAWEPIF